MAYKRFDSEDRGIEVDVERSCGHVERHEIWGKKEETRNKRIKFLKETICQKCEMEEVEKESKGLPELDKGINITEGKRCKSMIMRIKVKKEIESLIESLINSGEKERADFFKKVLEEALKIQYCGFWIDPNFSSLNFYTFLEEQVKCGYFVVDHSYFEYLYKKELGAKHARRIYGQTC